MHYVGDIHQPLHASTRVNSQYPSGDRGGNNFPVATNDSINELHAVWDSILYEFTGYETLVSIFFSFISIKAPILDYLIYLKFNQIKYHRKQHLKI
jgi:hypothetical protein